LDDKGRPLFLLLQLACDIGGRLHFRTGGWIAIDLMTRSQLICRHLA
jgi:hypothetical protein